MTKTLILILAASLPLAAQSPNQPAFIGALACAKCHSAIYARQERTHHAESLRPPAAIPELTARLPARVDSAVALVISRATGGQLQLTAANEHTLHLHWAFGSGAKGITPVGRDATGAFRESRLTWYRSSSAFALTPGATAFNPQTPADELGRPLSEKEVKECFSCHTTGYSPGQPEPTRNEMGVRCESCHGPGSAHAAAMAAAAPSRDRRILHPGRMDALAQVRLCGNCHGKAPADTDLAAIRAIEANPNTARFPSTRLVLSRCFNESAEGLKCTQCHDPHANVDAERARFDRSCRSCHACPKANKGCSGCHMPKAKVMAQSEFTDHWIRVVSARPRP